MGSGAIPTQEFVVGSKLISGPPFFPFPVAIFHNGGVLDEGHVAAAFHEASEGPRVSEVVLHMVALAVVSGRPVAEVAQMTEFPIMSFVADVILVTHCPRDARLVEVFSGGPEGVTSIITNPFV